MSTSYAGPLRAPGDGEAPTDQLVTASVGDACAVCGAPLARDQRYCVECGERRGKPRFTLSQASPSAAAATPKGRAARRGGWSANVTLIAGVATLLLAMGVGLLIGRSGNSSGSNKPQVVTVAGAAAPATSAATAGAATPATPAATPATGSAAQAPAAAAKTPAPKAAAVSAAAAGAASSVLHSSTKLAPPKVTVGSSCSGAGCQGGHFTGNFFGG
jgi:hypothetical protein